MNLQDLTTHLGVTNQDQYGVRALGVEGVDLAGDGLDTLNNGVGVAHVSAGRLTTACWVVDCLSSRTRERALDGSDNGSGCTIAWWYGGLACTEDVHLRALGCGEGGSEQEE